MHVKTRDPSPLFKNLSGYSADSEIKISRVKNNATQRKDNVLGGTLLKKRTTRLFNP